MDFSDGKLEIILGTMFSGKTSYMLGKIAFFADLGFKILYINIEFDNRSDTSFSTHNPFLNTKEYSKKGNIEKNVCMIKSKQLTDIEYSQYDIVIIDEAHFFDDIVDYVHLLLKNKKYVIVGSLIGDFQGNKFGKVYDLIPQCDNIHRLQAYCGICSKDKKCRVAIYSKRMSESKETIEIGGSEKYIPVCREHYFEL
jgi:thymidine kinase